MLFDPRAHDPLGPAESWTPARAAAAIRTIADETERTYDPEALWPEHPLDADGPPAPLGLYLGAAGVLWALDLLARTGQVEPARDWGEVAAGLHGRYVAAPDLGRASPSLFLGEAGILLVTWLLRASPEAAERLAQEIASNEDSDERELLWGSPGTMLAARALWQRTQDERWRHLWRESARRLLAARDADGLWTQNLYGDVRRYLGPAHGFAGIALALAQEPSLLDEAASFERHAVEALRRTAIVEGALANWPPVAGSPLATPDGSIRVQWCHGAPGMVASLARIATADAEHERLLVAGGELTWQAGPLRKGPGLCHGTAGNGLAFLELFGRTGDERWLERARLFGMHAIGQVERARAAHGRGRFTLWTGDLGVAVYLALCLAGRPDSPTLELW